MVLYIDDLYIFSKDGKSLLEHIYIVFSGVKEHNLFVAPSKCLIRISKVAFLVLIVEICGIHVNPENFVRF